MAHAEGIVTTRPAGLIDAAINREGFDPVRVVEGVALYPDRAELKQEYPELDDEIISLGAA